MRKHRLPDTYVFENGDCILRCRLKHPKPKSAKVNVVWTRNGSDNPIAINDQSYDEMYTVVSSKVYAFDLKIRKVSQQDDGSIFSCLIYNDTITNSTSSIENFNSTHTLLKSAHTNLRVLESPGIEYPKCTGKPVNYPIKTFVLSCCTERVSTAELRLQ